MSVGENKNKFSRADILYYVQVMIVFYDYILHCGCMRQYLLV
jgi:hypothetical protein